MIDEVLYKKEKDEILRKCNNPSEVPLVLKGFYNDICSRHFVDIINYTKDFTSKLLMVYLFL